MVSAARERLADAGPEALTTNELLAALWGARATTVGSLAEHGDVAELARADVAELRLLPGVGAARAAQLAAAFELGRRAASAPASGRWVVRSPADVAGRLTLPLGPLEREELHVLLLNAKNVVQRQVLVYRGNVSTALVRIGELFRDAVRSHAAGTILVHNHPSGDPEPSPDDLHLTAEAIAAGRLLDICVLDHLVIAAGGYVSLRDRGIAFDLPSRPG